MIIYYIAYVCIVNENNRVNKRKYNIYLYKQGVTDRRANIFRASS